MHTDIWYMHTYHACIHVCPTGREMNITMPGTTDVLRSRYSSSKRWLVQRPRRFVPWWPVFAGWQDMPYLCLWGRASRDGEVSTWSWGQGAADVSDTCECLLVFFMERMHILGCCNGLRCVINIILSLSLSLWRLICMHVFIWKTSMLYVCIWIYIRTEVHANLHQSTHYMYACMHDTGMHIIAQWT